MGCDNDYAHPSSLKKHLDEHRRLLELEVTTEAAGPSPPSSHTIHIFREHPAQDVPSSSWSTDQRTTITHQECQQLVPGHSDRNPRPLSPNEGVLHEGPSQWAIEGSEAHGSTSNSQHHVRVEVDPALILPIPVSNHRRNPLDIAPIPPFPSCYLRPDTLYLFR